MRRPNTGEWKQVPASTTALKAKEIHPSALLCLRENSTRNRAFLLEATDFYPVGAILSITADIRTRRDAVACGQNASTQAIGVIRQAI